MDFRVSGCAPTLQPFGSIWPLFPSGFLIVLTTSIVALVCRTPIFALVPQISSSTLGFRAVDVACRFLRAPWFRLSQSVPRFCPGIQSKLTLAPRTVGFTMVSLSTDSSSSLSITLRGNVTVTVLDSYFDILLCFP